MGNGDAQALTMRRGAVPRALRIALAALAFLGTPHLAPTLAAQSGARGAAAPTRRATQFAAMVERLSEPGGQFDTDNLISNERSYLHVMGALDRLGVRGGAYVGVGPDQNFSYIARVRPSIAFVIDIRRDNLLQHLLFKALFARARNRAEYLALLLGRPVPRDVERWSRAPIDSIVAWIDRTPASDSSAAAARALVLASAPVFGVPLAEGDLATIARFHSAFIDAGLDLRFTSAGRAPRAYYPTLRQLVLERDLEGRQASYLASEASFRFVKELQRRDLVVPVVGDLAGTHALAAVGRLVRQRGERVSAFYVSNVEDYLFRDGSFEQYTRTVSALPRDRRSVIVRSWFGRFREPHPLAVDGFASTQLLQRLDDFAADVAAGGYASYRDLTTRNPVPPR